MLQCRAARTLSLRVYAIFFVSHWRHSTWICTFKINNFISDLRWVKKCMVVTKSSVPGRDVAGVNSVEPRFSLFP
jgi:hypothetical protein